MQQMMGRTTFTVVATLALASCLVAIPLLGCQDTGGASHAEATKAPAASTSAAQSPSDAPASSDAAQDSAPTLQTTTSSVTIPVDFFEILGISEHGREKFLENMGATDITAQDDGSYVVNLSSADFDAFASHAYQAIQDKIKSSTTDGTYTDVVSVDYDETFATVVVVLSSKAIPDQDAGLAASLGNAANIYQQIANLPVDCDVIVMNSDGEQLFESSYPETGTSKE